MNASTDIFVDSWITYRSAQERIFRINMSIHGNLLDYGITLEEAINLRNSLTAAIDEEVKKRINLLSLPMV